MSRRLVLVAMTALVVISTVAFFSMGDFSRERTGPQRLSDLLSPFGDPLASLSAVDDDSQAVKLQLFRKSPSQLSFSGASDRVFNATDVPRGFMKTGQVREWRVLGRSFLVLEPFSVLQRRTAAITSPVPLVLVFHDDSSSAWQTLLFRSGLGKHAARHDHFVVAFLQAEGGPAVTHNVDQSLATSARWRAQRKVAEDDIHDDVAFTGLVLDHLLLSQPVDRRQIFALGFGAASSFVCRVAVQFAATLASAALVGAGGRPVDEAIPSFPERLPALLVVTKIGDADRHLAVEARDVWRGSNGEAKLLELPESCNLKQHNATLEGEVLSFFRTHRLTGA